MLNGLRNRHFFISDLVFVGVAAYLSFVLRLEDESLGRYWAGFVIFTGLALLITPLIFRWRGIYRRYWRYASVEEMVLLCGSVVMAVALTTLLGTIATTLLPLVAIPRSIPFIFTLLVLGMTASSRMAVRLSTLQHQYPKSSSPSSRVVVVGAGDAGRLTVRELQQNPQAGMEVVCFVDDSPAKQGLRIHGVLVAGTRQMLPEVVQRFAIDQVIIAMPVAPGKVIREIVNACEQLGVRTKTLPGLYDLLGGNIGVNLLRNVQIEDLLRRAPVETDFATVSDLLHGKRVLISGGGGSIGSELCRQVLRCRPAEIIILGHGENSIFEIHNELRRQIIELYRATGSGRAESHCRLTPVLADIRFADRIHAIFEQHRPEIVFHAAAHKHVPLMEANPAEAITNNVLGTRNLLDAAMAVDVDHFVMISTDKAVNPTSIMGACKRVSELLVHRAATRSGKPYVAVRFGNVLGSRGSVVLTFRQQIAAGGPVTVTDPEMRRYFMIIPEAVQLVLQAAVLGRGGEVFVLDMGEPVKIVDLARDMIELSGLEVGRDIDIIFTGMRPGEKMFEELFVKGEVYHRTEHEKIFIAGNASSFVPMHLDQTINQLSQAAHQNDSAAIRRGLEHLIPEFIPPATDTFASIEAASEGDKTAPVHLNLSS